MNEAMTAMIETAMIEILDAEKSFTMHLQGGRRQDQEEGDAPQGPALRPRPDDRRDGQRDA